MDTTDQIQTTTELSLTKSDKSEKRGRGRPKKSNVSSGDCSQASQKGVNLTSSRSSVEACEETITSKLEQDELSGG